MGEVTLSNETRESDHNYPNDHKDEVSLVFEVICETRARVFHTISKHQEMGSKNEAQPSFVLNQLRGVWKSDERLFSSV